MYDLYAAFSCIATVAAILSDWSDTVSCTKNSKQLILDGYIKSSILTKLIRQSIRVVDHHTILF